MNRLVFFVLFLTPLFVFACVSAAERAEDIAKGAFGGGNYSKSFGASQVLIQEEPENPMGYIIAGDSLVKLKRYEQARPYYEELLRVLARQPEPEEYAGEVLATEFKLQRVSEGRGWTRGELIAGIERGLALRRAQAAESAPDNPDH